MDTKCATTSPSSQCPSATATPSKGEAAAAAEEEEVDDDEEEEEAAGGVKAAAMASWKMAPPPFCHAADEAIRWPSLSQVPAFPEEAGDQYAAAAAAEAPEDEDEEVAEAPLAMAEVAVEERGRERSSRTDTGFFVLSRMARARDAFELSSSSNFESSHSCVTFSVTRRFERNRARF